MNTALTLTGEELRKVLTSVPFKVVFALLDACMIMIAQMRMPLLVTRTLGLVWSVFTIFIVRITMMESTARMSLNAEMRVMMLEPLLLLPLFLPA
jgi:hypothetical protein